MEHPAHTLATLKVASTSKPLTFQVKRQAQEHFVAPTVLEAANNGNGPLDPIKATSGATVRVKYERMLTSDTLEVTWNGVNQADSWKSESENGSTSGHVDFAVPVSVVAASQGKTIQVLYAVVRNGQSNPSVSLTLPVNTLAQQELPAPEVPQAKNGDLDLTTFTGDATVKVLKSTGSVWPLWAEKQTYWIVLEGTLTDGKEYTHYLVNKGGLSEAQGNAGLSIELPRAQLENLKDNSTLTVTLKVGYDTSGIESDARVFQQQTIQSEARSNCVRISQVYPSALSSKTRPGRKCLQEQKCCPVQGTTSLLRTLKSLLMAVRALYATSNLILQGGSKSHIYANPHV